MVKLEQRDITVAQKNELRRLLKSEGKSLIEMQSELVKTQQEQDDTLTVLDLAATVDKYLPWKFQVKALEYGYEGYKHDKTDLTDFQMAECVMKVVQKEFWRRELEKKS